MNNAPTCHELPFAMAISASGGIVGASRHYEKTLGEMRNVYRSDEALDEAILKRNAEDIVYWVDEQRYDNASGSLIVGTSTLLPARFGDEFAVTRGHLHAKSDRAELYYCLSGHGVMLLETIDGASEAVQLTPGEAVNVPGEWIHRSVNVGEEPFVTLFCYAADAGQDYGIIARAGGMKSLIVSSAAEGWSTLENPDHHGYSGEVSK